MSRADKNFYAPKVRNTAVIRKTAKEYIFKSRGKSLVIILSIALCTFLFTTLFTVGGTILKKLEASINRQVGTTAAESFKYLNEAEYARLAADKKLKEVSEWIIVGDVANSNLLKLRTEVHWSDEMSAAKGFCLPEAGKMPTSEDEAAFSSLVLASFGLNASPSEYETLLGKKVTLSIDIKGELIEKEFVVCGVFTGDRVSMAQTVLVSKSFQEKYAPVPERSYYDEDKDYDPYDVYGRINADIDFHLPFAINSQLASAIMRDDLPAMVQIGVNNSSMTGKMDPGTLLLVGFLIVTIFLSGYLIINNIYRINVYSDIRSYGLLKTIGMSGRQLSSLVKWQALYLCVPGIILGMLGGSLVGNLIVPFVMSIISVSENVDASPVMNIWVLIFSAVFSFVTVRVSCRKPAKIASKVSPIEAVRYTEGSRIGGSSRNVRVVNAHNHRFSDFSFALRNFGRDKMKVFWVILSLSLSLVILNSVYTLIHSFNEDKFVQEKIATDFSVSDATLDNSSVPINSRNISGITQNFLDGVAALQGIEQLGNIYFENTYQVFTDEDFTLLDERLLKHPRMETIVCYSGIELVKDVYEEARANSVFVYGADEFVLENLPVIHGKLDMEKFATGQYILVNEYSMRLSSGEPSLPYFMPGDKITVSNNYGDAKQYEVMATVDMPYAFRFQVFSNLDMFYILPSAEFNSFFGERTPMRCLFNVTDEAEDDIEAWMESFTTEEEPLLTYTSRKVYKQEFKSFTGMIVIVGGLLTGILALIGLLNLANTMITSIMSRKLELAMLEAVGMTKRTQIKSVCIEGVLYAVFTAVAGIVLGSIFSFVLVRPFGKGMWYFDWHFSLMPIAAVFPIMVAITLILPVIIYKNAMKSSVVERLSQTGQ